MPDENMALLIEKYLDGIATPEEIKLVDEWYESFATKPALFPDGSRAARQSAKANYAALCKKLGLRQGKELIAKDEQEDAGH